MPELTTSQARLLAWWSFGIAMTGSCGRCTVATFLGLLCETKIANVEQRLYEWWESRGYFTPKIDPNKKPFTIVIGDTGISAPTKESVADVRRLWMNDKARWETVFDKIGEIAFTARRAIEAGKSEMLGELMDENHALLQTMTVSSKELDRLVEAARVHFALVRGDGRAGIVGTHQVQHAHLDGPV
jgi:mevalonate kinase